MSVFLLLTQQVGLVVTRKTLFEHCWGRAAVGDDSLNRTLTRIRQMLGIVGATELTIETVPRTGYRLVERGGPPKCGTAIHPAATPAYDCWRLGLPCVDAESIALLEAALANQGGDASDWGMLALLLRKAAEYADSADCAGFVGRCETAARKALAVDPEEPNARTALAGLSPLFGNWISARMELIEVTRIDPDHPPTLHDLAVLEMATGRPITASPIMERLLVADRFAATFHYKRMYHLWALGDLRALEQISAQALALWPRHPAIWIARFWTLIFTSRSDQAVRLAADEHSLPPIPPAAFRFLKCTAELVRTRERGTADDQAVSAHAATAVSAASSGPANAVAALMSLCAIDAIDQAFEVANGYYLGRGIAATPLRWNAQDPSITDQHRRVTQPLFIPSAEGMRQDPRFTELCRDIGMADYWARFSIVPDFLQQT